MTEPDADNLANWCPAVSTAEPSANGYGTYTVDASGHWTYTLNNSNATIQALKATDHKIGRASCRDEDGTAQLVKNENNGANDAAVVSGTNTGTVMEAGEGNNAN